MEQITHLPQQDSEKNEQPVSSDQQRLFMYTKSVSGAGSFFAQGYTAEECSHLMHSQQLAVFKKRIYFIIAGVLLSVSFLLLSKIGAVPMF